MDRFAADIGAFFYAVEAQWLLFAIVITCDESNTIRIDHF
jgi:hypothetical protein